MNGDLAILDTIEFLKLKETDPLGVIAILQKHHPDLSVERLTSLVTAMFKEEREALPSGVTSSSA
jgi:hypothetical protein